MKTLFFISIGTRPIGKIVRVIANYPGDQGSIPGRVILKTKKKKKKKKKKKRFMIMLSIKQRIKYGSRVSGATSGKVVASSLTPRCSRN